MCGCCVSECNSMESDPDFLGPAALAKGSASSATRASRTNLPSEQAQRGARDLGLHAVLLLQRALPEGRRPAAIAKLGAESMKGIDHDMGAKHARFVISAKTTRLAARDRARAQDAGVVSAIKASSRSSCSGTEGTCRFPPRRRPDPRGARPLRHRPERRAARRARHRPVGACAREDRPGASRGAAKAGAVARRPTSPSSGRLPERGRRVKVAYYKAASPRCRRRSSTRQRRRWPRASGWSSRSSTRSPAAARATSTRRSRTTTST